MRRKSMKKALCPVARSLDEIGDWWSLLIVRDAFLGHRRFGDFQRRLGVSRNILTIRLRTLTERGILEREPASDGSAYREYVLTQKGRELFPVLVALTQWGSEHLFPKEPCGTAFVDDQSGKPVRRLEVRAVDGRALGPDDAHMKRA